VNIGQLRAAGLSNSAVAKRARTGRLHRIHRGVYAVGHAPLSYRGRCMAATLTFEVVAVVSHRSAAALWELLPPVAGPIHVSVLSNSGLASRRGLDIHRRPSLAANGIGSRHAIPVTTVAQTIADLRGKVPATQLRRVTRQAEVLGFRTGTEETGDRTRSELEHIFLRLCERSGLPMPEVNVRIGSRTVDFLWRDRQLVVETDGYRYHRGQAAFEDDHDRDLELRAQGYNVLRFTYRQVTEHPKDLARLLTKELAKS
jgi:hypothetical protein